SGQDSSTLQRHATRTALQKSVNDRIADVVIDGQLPTVETRVTTSLGALMARSSGTMTGRYSFSLPRGVMISEELSVRLSLVTAHPMVGRDTLLSRSLVWVRRRHPRVSRPIPGREATRLARTDSSPELAQPRGCERQRRTDTVP